LEILKQPARQEAHAAAAPDVTEIASPRQVLQGSPRIRAAQEIDRLFEVEKLDRRLVRGSDPRVRAR